MYDQTNGGCFQFKKDLKFILLDNGDLLDLIPVGRSVYIKELYGHRKTVLDLLKYYADNWIVALDL